MLMQIERLKRDHKILRAKLDVLEAALDLGPDAWFALREMCFTLSRQLADHIRREEALIGAARRELDARMVDAVTLEHQDEPQLLRTINRLFVTERGQTLERVGPALRSAVSGLRRHMAEEERELFPVLEHVVHEAPPAPGHPGHFDETMTVNRILHDHPSTEPVFKRLFVNVPLEGCECVDEVAWRHGMDSRELLQQLDEIVDASEADRELHAASHAV